MIRKAGLAANHPLVKRRRALSWATDPNACTEWCKSVATAIMDTDQDILKKFMIRGQMMIASQCPNLFLRKMLETNCEAEEM
jgi:hypothetical protein